MSTEQKMQDKVFKGQVTFSAVNYRQRCSQCPQKLPQNLQRKQMRHLCGSKDTHFISLLSSRQ